MPFTFPFPCFPLHSYFHPMSSGFTPCFISTPSGWFVSQVHCPAGKGCLFSGIYTALTLFELVLQCRQLYIQSSQSSFVCLHPLLLEGHLEKPHGYLCNMCLPVRESVPVRLKPPLQKLLCWPLPCDGGETAESFLYWASVSSVHWGFWHFSNLTAGQWGWNTTCVKKTFGSGQVWKLVCYRRSAKGFCLCARKNLGVRQSSGKQNIKGY